MRIVYFEVLAKAAGTFLQGSAVPNDAKLPLDPFDDLIGGKHTPIVDNTVQQASPTG